MLMNKKKKNSYSKSVLNSILFVEKKINEKNVCNFFFYVETFTFI